MPIRISQGHWKNRSLRLSSADGNVKTGQAESHGKLKQQENASGKPSWQQVVSFEPKEIGSIDLSLLAVSMGKQP
jgi:hypothetical protein